jgi:hypothetical protein
VSFSYNPSLPADLDWVRFLIGDVSSSSAMLQDEEITAALAERASTVARKYLTAADLLSALHTRWMSTGRGVASRKVSRLTVVYGTGAGINVDAAVQAKVSELRRRGARLLTNAPHSLRAL